MIAILSARSQLGAICKNDSTVRPTVCLQGAPSILPPLGLWLHYLGSSPSTSSCKNIVPFLLLKNFLPEFALTGKLLALLWMYRIINEAPLSQSSPTSLQRSALQTNSPPLSGWLLFPPPSSPS